MFGRLYMCKQAARTADDACFGLSATFVVRLDDRPFR
jgi:hypothetical protein